MRARGYLHRFLQAYRFLGLSGPLAFQWRNHTSLHRLLGKDLVQHEILDTVAVIFPQRAVRKLHAVGPLAVSELRTTRLQDATVPHHQHVGLISLQRCVDVQREFRALATRILPAIDHPNRYLLPPLVLARLAEDRVRDGLLDAQPQWAGRRLRPVPAVRAHQRQQLWNQQLVRRIPRLL